MIPVTAKDHWDRVRVYLHDHNDYEGRSFLRNLEWWAKIVVRVWVKVYPSKSTICNDRISLPGVAGCLGGATSPPMGLVQSPDGGPRCEAPRSSSKCAVHSHHNIFDTLRVLQKYVKS